jgi:hypothetical protein
LGKCINETVPIHLLAKYALFNNAFTWLGLVAAGWVNMILPDPAATNEELMKQDNYWKVVYGFKIVPQIVGIIFSLIYLKNPSLNLLIKEN